MKANELMIGDWVSYEQFINNDSQYVYSKVDLTLLEHAYIGITKVAPIPLTEEILEANGFLDYGEIKEYQFKEDGEELRFYLKKMYNKDNVQDAWGTNIGGVLPSVIMYVHELQHALRLCGLNELSDNFKIE